VLQRKIFLRCRVRMNNRSPSSSIPDMAMTKILNWIGSSGKCESSACAVDGPMNNSVRKSVEKLAKSLKSNIRIDVANRTFKAVIALARHPLRLSFFCAAPFVRRAKKKKTATNLLSKERTVVKRSGDRKAANKNHLN
jgi:hypothetical protein